MLTIGFNLKNEYGEEYLMTSTEDPESEVYDDDVDFIGQKLNIFLKQCGYHRENDYIFMKDVTADEYCALDNCLSDLRVEDK